MFENLSLRGFTFPREPILYLTLLVAVVNVVIQLMNGDVDGYTGAETIFLLVVGFFARGRVSPA